MNNCINSHDFFGKIVLDAVIHEKTKFYASGHYTEFYNALWHQQELYPPVMPGTNHVLVM